MGMTRTGSIRGRFLAALGASIMVGIMFAWLPLQVAAADLRQGSDVTVGPGETINDNIYAGAGTISINGTVNGTVFAGGGTITVSGNIARDLIIGGGTINVTGHVGGSIIAAGGNLTLNGPVAQDIVVTGGTIDVGSGATIGRDLVVAGGMGDGSGAGRPSDQDGSGQPDAAKSRRRRRPWNRRPSQTRRRPDRWQPRLHQQQPGRAGERRERRRNDDPAHSHRPRCGSGWQPLRWLAAVADWHLRPRPPVDLPAARRRYPRDRYRASAALGEPRHRRRDLRHHADRRADPVYRGNLHRHLVVGAPADPAMDPGSGRRLRGIRFPGGAADLCPSGLGSLPRRPRAVGRPGRADRARSASTFRTARLAGRARLRHRRAGAGSNPARYDAARSALWYWRTSRRAG